jgi:hypothetical protein
MNQRLSSALFCVALIGATGCDEKKEPAGGTSTSTTSTSKTTGTATATATGTAATPASAPAPAAGELEEVKNDKGGYSIKLPKGHESSKSDETGGSYTSGTLIVTVTSLAKIDAAPAVAKVDDVLRAVNTGTGKVEKKTVGDVFVAVVTQTDVPMNSIYSGVKGGKVTAHCMAEPKDTATAEQICSSLKLLK